MDLPTAYQAVEDIFNSGSHKLERKLLLKSLWKVRRHHFVLCNGQKLLPIGTAQDHKRVGDGDTDQIQVEWVLTHQHLF